MSTTRTLLSLWLEPRIPATASAWLQEKAALFAAEAQERIVFPAFSATVRHVGKAPLDLSAAALSEAAALVEGWDPRDWTLDQTARILLLLSLPPGDRSARLMDEMYQTADVGETLALMKALPLLPDPRLHMARAREAIRSNVKAQFEAVALRNPYAAKHVDDIGWNQLVTKTLFVDSPLDQVWGLDRRVNPALGRILTDLAFERWAAGRTFPPLLWRCVGPVAEGRAFEALERVLRGPDAVHGRAATLALAANQAPEAARLLAESPYLPALRAGRLTWENLDA